MMPGRVGIAWESGRLVCAQVVEGEAGTAVRWVDLPAPAAVAPLDAEPSAGPFDAEALGAALESAGIDARRATIAVGGGVAVVKPVVLPPVPAPTRLAILRQDGERYFLLPPAPRCYGLWGETEDGGTWVAAAPEEALRSLVAAVEGAGVAVDAVTLGPALYRDALRFLLGRDAVVPRTVARSADGAHEIVTSRAGRVMAYSRWEGEAYGVLEPLDELEPETSVALLTDDAGDTRLLAADPRFVVPETPGVERPAYLLAAIGAACADPELGELPDLLPPSVREGRRRASTRRTAAFTAATAFLVVLFLALVAFRRDRRDDHLAEELAVVQAQAEPVIAMRTDLERISREIVAHRQVVRERTDWLELLQELSLALPEDAWLAGLEAREDGEVVVTGYARSAGDVLTALTASPRLGEVRFQTQAARTQVAGRAVESFSLAVEWIDAPE